MPLPPNVPSNCYRCGHGAAMRRFHTGNALLWVCTNCSDQLEAADRLRRRREAWKGYLILTGIGLAVAVLVWRLIAAN